MMERTYYTFLVFPGAHGRLRRIHIPAFLLQLGVGFALVGVLTVGALANTYAHMLLKVSNYNTMRAERQALTTYCRTLEGAITRSKAELGSLQSLAAEVAVSYNFSEKLHPRFSPDVLRVARLGVAGLGANYNASLYAFNLMKARPVFAATLSDVPSAFPQNVYQDSATPSIWPVRGQITAGFGQRMDPFTGEGAFHRGVDIGAAASTPVRAAADGILFHAGPDAGYGNEALIDHGDGVTTKYGHLRTLCVVVGEEVSRGQVIGTVGMTGRATGPHLHYEVLVHDTPVNPVTYLRQ